jgi:bifunctional non-homologous end joining protein LigD
MALETYRAKRDFRVTPEPGPTPARPHAKPIFVIQEHHASRLHYDFRLEADGVLKSWAVPKEPSMDPADKRLAVHVEDHPLEYASFKGRIPEGQYGAGTVRIWDKGTYENLLAEKSQPLSVSQAIDAGRLEFLLHGKKLKGRFALIRMKNASPKGKDNWLLIKMRDEFARAANGKVAEASRATPPGHRGKPGGSPRQGRGSDKGVFAFTHTDKVLFPDSGITKGDVLSFYSHIAPHLLPFLRDRPVTVERLPDGLAGPDSPRFWQKNTPEYYPAWIRRVNLPTERGKPVHYALVNSIQTLLYMVNQGALTFHTWLSRVEDPDRPDFVLFDLDPGGAKFAAVITVALSLRKILKGEGERAFVKTTGKSGLHVLVPWNQDGGYDEARAWALGLANRVAEEVPEKATTEIRKVKRGSRVYVDTMQNARGHHAVPPYVVRAVPAATVSTPLEWNDLTPALDPARFTMATLLRRVARQKKDPLAPLLKED